MNAQVQVVDFTSFVFASNNDIKTTSLLVAEKFGKQHKNVLATIDKILTQVSDSFGKLNFKPSEYVQNNNLGIPVSYRMFEMTKDGFMILVMGFTGVPAMAIKENYINAFNFMLEKLRSKPYGLKETAPTYLTPEMCDQVTVRVNELCKIEGKHYNTYYRKLKDVFHVNSYTLIPISKYADVCQWLGCKPTCKIPEYIMVEASEIGELRLRRPNFDDDVVVSNSRLWALKQFAFGLLPYNSVVIDGGRYDELVQAEQKLKSAEEALRDKPMTYREWVDVMDKMDTGDMVLLKKIV